MFNNTIIETPFTSGAIWNMYSTRFSVDLYLNDASMRATLLALLKDRLPENNTLRVRYARMHSGVNFMRVLSNAQHIDHFMMVASIPADIDGDRVFKVIADTIHTQYSGYTHLEAVEAWFDQKGIGKTAIYINEEAHRTLVFMQNVTIKKWHLIQAFIKKLMPWFFSESPLTEQERQLIISLYSPDGADQYTSILQDMASAMNIRKILIDTYISNYEKHSLSGKIDRLTEQINSLMGEMRALMNSYSERSRSLGDLNMRLNGLRYAQNGADQSELTEFFYSNMELSPELCYEGIQFVVSTHLEYFDADMAETFINNPDSYFYHFVQYLPSSLHDKHAALEKIWRAVFSDEPKLRIRMVSCYHLTDNGVRAISEHDYSDEFGDHIPNPHIQYYSCLGGYFTYIQNAIDRGDMVGAVQQCVASARSVNVGESITFARLAEDICRAGSKKCFELPDGSVATLEEAYAWLEKEENA